MSLWEYTGSVPPLSHFVYDLTTNLLPRTSALPLSDYHGRDEMSPLDAVAFKSPIWQDGYVAIKALVTTPTFPQRSKPRDPGVGDVDCPPGFVVGVRLRRKDEDFAKPDRRDGTNLHSGGLLVESLTNYSCRFVYKLVKGANVSPT